MNDDIATLISELREHAAFYSDRPAVPAAEYPAAREISRIETTTLSDLLSRAADALMGRTDV